MVSGQWSVVSGQWRRARVREKARAEAEVELGPVGVKVEGEGELGGVALGASEAGEVVALL